jgi:hypothetical protein
MKAFLDQVIPTAKLLVIPASVAIIAALLVHFLGGKLGLVIVIGILAGVVAFALQIFGVFVIIMDEFPKR